MTTVYSTTRRLVSTHGPGGRVGLVDGLTYFALSYGIITGSNALHNHLHPNNTSTFDQLSMIVGLASCALLAGLIGGISSDRARMNLMNRSLVRTIIGTTLVIASTTALFVGIFMLTSDMGITLLDITQTVALIGLIPAPFGYRLLGFVENPNVETLTVNIGDGTQPALGVGDKNGLLGVWTPGSDSNKK